MTAEELTGLRATLSHDMSMARMVEVMDQVISHIIEAQTESEEFSEGLANAEITVVEQAKAEKGKHHV